MTRRLVVTLAAFLSGYVLTSLGWTGGVVSPTVMRRGADQALTVVLAGAGGLVAAAGTFVLTRPGRR